MTKSTDFLPKLAKAIDQPVTDAVSIIATHAAMTADGLRARLELWNGSVLDAATLLVDQPDDRRGYAQRVRAAHPGETFDSPTVEGALLRLASGTAQALGATAEASDRARESQASALVRLATEAGAELWHTPEGTCYATIGADGHHEHHRLGGKPYRRWLARRYYDATGTAPGAQALSDALGVLEGRATFDGAEHAVAVRLTEHASAIYLDLCNDAWQAVEVTAEGWRVVNNPPVRFARPKGLLPLPEPRRGGSLTALRACVSTASDHDWRLIVSWLVACLCPRGPYPMLCLYGEQGAGKSTTARLLASLIDPRQGGLRAEPHELRDLMIAASNGWLVALDNLSAVAGWLSDGLCRLSTGGGLAVRQLYSDDEETIFAAQRPALLTAIEEVVVRGDLLDRALVVTLPTIPEDRRRPEADLWAAFEAARPGTLGALLDAASAALRNLPTTRLARLPRMADFARWACAAAPALGWTAQDFLDSYAGNRADAHTTALEALVWLPWLQKLTLPWRGTAGELLDALGALAGEAETRRKGWPTSARGMAGALRRAAPDLRATGVGVTFAPRGRGGVRPIVVEQVGGRPSPSSPPSPTRGGPGDDGDDWPLAGDGWGEQPSPDFGAAPSGASGQGDGGDGGDDSSPIYSEALPARCPDCGARLGAWKANPFAGGVLEAYCANRHVTRAPKGGAA